MKILRILLFGCKGQVGQEIVDLSNKLNYIVHGFDVDTLDITDLNQLTQCFDKLATDNVDVVINASAYTAVDKAEDDKDLAFAVNDFAVKNIAVLCKKFDLPLLHMSTDYVFSGDANRPYIETDEPKPLGVYGESKYLGELSLQECWHKHVILRTSWVFGKYGNNFVKTILRLAKERDEVNVVSDQFGCPTSASSLAKTLLCIAEKIVNKQSIKWGVYHYCNSPATNWYEFAQNIVAIAKKLPQYIDNNASQFKLQNLNKITTAEYPTKAKRPQYSVLTCDKIVRDYAIQIPDWHDELQEVLEKIMPIAN